MSNSNIFFLPAHTLTFQLVRSKYRNPIRIMMSETRSMFLEMTPAMHQMDSIPGPTDQVTLNMAVGSFSLTGDTTGEVANSLKTPSDDDKASLSQSNGMSPEEDKAKPHPTSDMPTDSFSPPSMEEDMAKPHSVGEIPPDSLSSPSVEDHLGDKILPVGQNSTQDAVATTLTTEFLSPATTLKRRLEITKDLIVCPGVYDGFSARIALSVGFDALYMVSNTCSRLPVPVCSYHPDRCRHHGLSPRPARPRPCTAQRHASSCGHDRQP